MGRVALLCSVVFSFCWAHSNSVEQVPIGVRGARGSVVAFVTGGKFLLVQDRYIVRQNKCTAFFLAPTIVVTAAHCIDFGKDGVDVGGFRTVLGDDTSLSVKRIVGSSSFWDLALLEVEDGFGGSPLVFGARPAVGVVSYAMGYPEETFHTFTSRYSTLSGVVPDMLMDTVPALNEFEGLSGAPLFNADGEAVGVLTARKKSAMDRLLVVPAKFLARLAEDHGIIPRASHRFAWRIKSLPLGERCRSLLSNVLD